LVIEPTIRECTKPDEDLTPFSVTMGEEVESKEEVLMAAAKPAEVEGRNDRRVFGTISLKERGL
jgi:mannitol/fructose-specific phosphotransferase system IIA component (Ntr-type)